MYGTKGTGKPPEKFYSDELAGLERGPLEFLLVEIRATRGPFSVVRGREPGGVVGCQTVYKTVTVSILYCMLIH